MNSDTFLIKTASLASLGKLYHQSGKKLVLTNGCFDLLHQGHVRYLKEARQLGDALLVAINSDDSVKELKGPTRPLNNQLARAEVLSALKSVDYVTIFTEKRVSEIIKLVTPAIYVKGGDYTLETLDPEERKALEEVQAQIIILSLVPGVSTTQIIQKMNLPEK